MSTFPDRFVTDLQGLAQFCLKKFKDRVLFKKILLCDRVSFSGIQLQDRRAAFKISQQHLSICL